MKCVISYTNVNKQQEEQPQNNIMCMCINMYLLNENNLEVMSFRTNVF